MAMYTSHSYRIKVLILGRPEPIQSPRYRNKEEAEADLVKITDARQSKIEVDLPWLQMPGDQVQAAFIDHHSTSVGVPEVRQRPFGTDPLDGAF
jgi:hypothetical protein